MQTTLPFQHVAVLMGGPSAERDVSLRSGAAVARGLREAGYTVSDVDITEADVRLPAGVEAAFVALHGEYGEDGGIQAALDGMGVPYTGSGPESSRLSFDKLLTKRVLQQHGLPTAPYEVLANGDRRSLDLPVVTKPLRQGSSIGVHVVKAEDNWEAALGDSRQYGAEVMVEDFIDGVELTVGIVGDEALPVVRIDAPEGNYDFEAKYTRGATRYIVPADIDPALAEHCRDLGLRTFRAFDCRGFARVDMRATSSGDVFILELNSIPGFTETSLLPMAAAEAGMGFAILCDKIIRTATVTAPGDDSHVV